MKLEVVIVDSDSGEYNVFPQGSLPEIQRVGRCVILTLHDLGSSHLSLQDFFSLPCLAALTSTSLLLHISLPGQQPEAPDCPTTARYPSMQEMSEAVLGILDILNLTEVVILGVGAGANIAARVGLSRSSRVLGVVLVQPVLGRAGLLEQVRLRSVVSDLRLGPSKLADNFLLQHAFGKISQRERPAGRLVTSLTIYRDNLHCDINPRNLALLLDSFMKRSLTDSMKKLRFNCDVLTLVGEFSQKIRHKPLSDKSASFMKFSDVGNVILEAPEKAAEALLLFCQGLGLVPNVLGPRRTGGRHGGLSMMEADKPNIGRLSRL